MASPKDKIDAEAKRNATRSFPGYLLDKATGKEGKSMSDAEAADMKRPNVLGGKNPANKEVIEAAGYKRGGSVKSSPKSGGFRW